MIRPWWSSFLGKTVLSTERDALQTHTCFFHGEVQLQIGATMSMLPELKHSTQKIIMSNHAGSDVIAENEALPFRKRSIDTILMIHALESSPQPHQILREAERVLVYDGTLVIMCFNPWSLWGIRRLFSWRQSFPWDGHFFGLTRIKDWLALLNFEVVEVDHMLYQPPIKSKKWFQRFAFLTSLGKRFIPFFSGVTLIVASKRTIPLTPSKPKWQRQALFPTSSLANKSVVKEKSDG